MNPPTVSVPTIPTSAARRTTKQVLIFLALACALAGLHQHQDVTGSMKFMYRALDNRNSNTLEGCPSSNTQQQPPSPTQKKKEYPSQKYRVFYVPARGRRDRAGASIIDMMKAQAYSYQQGVAFGGACGDTPHRSTNEAMIQAIGLDPILKYACPPENSVDDGVKHEMITRDHFFHIPQQELFSEEWLEYIHNEVQPKSQRWQEEDRLSIDQHNNSNNNTLPIIKKSSNYTIAVHVRRGDVDPCGHWSFRYLPNSHYAGMIDHYKRQAPKDKSIQCIVFSEPNSLIETFEDFSNRGCQVVLGGDPTLAWKTMLDADVVIQSLSSFSHVPSLLNSHGVIAFTPVLSEPLRPNWKWHIYKHSNQAWRHWIDRCDEHYGKKKV